MALERDKKHKKGKCTKCKIVFTGIDKNRSLSMTSCPYCAGPLVQTSLYTTWKTEPYR